MNIISLLLGKWQYVVIAALLLAFAVQWQYTGAVKKDRDAAVSLSRQLKDELKISRDSIARLETSIQEQNKQIDAFKAAGDKKLEENKGKLAAAGKEAATIKGQAEEILKKQPAKDATACINANTLFNEEIKNAK